MQVQFELWLIVLVLEVEFLDVNFSYYFIRCVVLGISYFTFISLSFLIYKTGNNSIT